MTRIIHKVLAYDEWMWQKVRMADLRHKNGNWELRPNKDGTLAWVAVQVAVLMDIRDELKCLNQTFRCYRFLRIPNTLEAIRRNTTKKRKKKKP